MSYKKIMGEDTAGKGIANLSDTPSLSSEEMKMKFEEIAKDVIIPAFNELSGQLEEMCIEKRVLSEDVKSLRINADRQMEISKDGVNYETAGSSGHLILNVVNEELPQRGRLKFAGEVTVADDAQANTTIVQGLKGNKGDKGDIGVQGVQGVQGDKGKVYLPVLDDAGNIAWQLVHDNDTVPPPRNIRGQQGIQGMQGVQGEQGVIGVQGQAGAQGPQGPQGSTGEAGADGRSFTVHGRYPQLNDLKAAHPQGADGDAWIVGTVQNNHVFTWDINVNDWVDVGPIIGPMGAQGTQGIQGAKGEQGIQGIQGTQGLQGVQGERGIQGIQGEQGTQGLPTTINGKTGSSVELTAQDVDALPLKDIAKYQTKTDYTFGTQSKTVTGAVNEVNALAIKAFASVPNPNVLDNTNFQNPINQRGLLTYTSPKNDSIYMIDRWRILNGTYEVAAKRLTLNPTASTYHNAAIFQLIEWTKHFKIGDAMTLSVKINGVVYSLTGILPDKKGIFAKSFITPDYQLYINRAINDNCVSVGICNADTCQNKGVFDLEWIKLEKGDTATPYVPKNYSVELAECQRYFWIDYDNLIYLYNVGGYQYINNLIFPVTMRIAPTVTFQGVAGSLYLHQVWNGGVRLYGGVSSAGDYQAILKNLQASADL